VIAGGLMTCADAAMVEVTSQPLLAKPPHKTCAKKGIEVGAIMVLQYVVGDNTNNGVDLR
jgi:hypothetical protein